MGDLRFQNFIARGNFGSIDLYKRSSDGKNFVVKTIPYDSNSTILNEIKVFKLFDHPNVLKLHGFMVEELQLYIVMEYAEGGTLADFLVNRNGDLLNEKVVLHYFCQILIGLHHIFKFNILHRDLNPKNILLDRTKSIIKIADFGVSKLLETDLNAETFVGTPCYLSPEVCQGKKYGEKNDVWACGCILYEMMTLEKAFPSKTLLGSIENIIIGKYEPIHSAYSARLRNLVRRILTVDQNQRPSLLDVIGVPFILDRIFHLSVDIKDVLQLYGMVTHKLRVENLKHSLSS